MNSYHCPICGDTIPRDLVLFLQHGNQHVIESIRKAHPQWDKGDGVCSKCVDYYQKALHGEPVQKDSACGQKLNNKKE